MKPNKYYIFLEELRQSGITNMFGAHPYLMAEFDLEEKEAIKILDDTINMHSEKEVQDTARSVKALMSFSS